MKRLYSFKGYATETAYDETSGAFIASSVPHPFTAGKSAPATRHARVTVLKPLRREPIHADLPQTGEDAAQPRAADPSAGLAHSSVG